LSSASSPGDGVSKVVRSLSHQRGKETKIKTNRQTEKTNKKTTKQNKNPKFKWNLNPSASSSTSVIVSSKEEKKRKKKESVDIFVNVYLRLRLTCLSCQPAVAGGFIYADLRSELNTHLAPQALFI
jgi:hypothetical protein